MGVGTRSKAWRFTDINKDYSVRYRHTHTILYRDLHIPTTSYHQHIRRASWCLRASVTQPYNMPPSFAASVEYPP